MLRCLFLNETLWRLDFITYFRQVHYQFRRRLIVSLIFHRRFDLFVVFRWLIFHGLRFFHPFHLFLLSFRLFLGFHLGLCLFNHLFFLHWHYLLDICHLLLIFRPLIIDCFLFVPIGVNELDE